MTPAGSLKMRRYVLTALFLLLAATSWAASDEITPSTHGYFSVVRYEWTADGSGDATGVTTTTVPGLIYLAVTVPGTGDDQPDDNYDIVVKERYAAPGSGTVLLSTDVTGGALANRDEANTERADVWPDTWQQVGGYLEIQVTNAGANNTGAVELHIFRTLAFKVYELSEGSGDGLPTGGSTTQMLQNNGSGAAKWIDLSGDVTIADGGATTLEIDTEAAWESHVTDVTDFFTNNDTIPDLNLIDSLTVSSTGDVDARAIDIPDAVDESTVNDADTILIYDFDAGGIREMSRANFLSGVGGGPDERFDSTSPADGEIFIYATDKYYNRGISGDAELASDGTLTVLNAPATSDPGTIDTEEELNEWLEGALEGYPTYDTLAKWGAKDAHPPSSDYATLDTRNDHLVLDFDDSTDEAMYFYGSMPLAYDGGGIWVEIEYAMTSATSGEVVWGVAWENLSDEAQDLDADGFASAKTVTDTVSATSGKLRRAQLFFENTEIDGVVAKDLYRLKLYKDADAGADDASGDAEFKNLTAYESVSGYVEDPDAVLEAVIEVNGPEWLTEFRTPGPDGLTEYYAPHPVFFEGWKSTPRDEITQYKWDFDDGVEPDEYGFNAAHVFESAGTYTVELEVTQVAAVGVAGSTDTDTVTITVNAPDGTDYYVDSALGDDANAGTGTGASAWETATHAFEGIAEGRYGPGDVIYFERGQTFDFTPDSVQVGHWQSGYGYSFQARGAGAKPVIRSTSPGGGTLFNLTGVGTRFISFVDLEFNCSPVSGDRSLFWAGTGGGCNILFLRCDIKNFVQGLVWNASLTGNGVASGFFFMDSTTYDSEITHAFFAGERLAVVGSSMEYSRNHLFYGGVIKSAYIYDSTFEHPSFGRCALRVTGSSLDNLSSNIWVSDSDFLGWQDPNYDGTSYNYLLVNFGPNDDAEKFGEYLHFKNNTVTDSQVMMNVAGWEHVVVEDSDFTSPDPSPADKFHLAHNLGWDHRPLYDIKITDNWFESTASTGNQHALVALWPYLGPTYPDRDYHEGIVFERNVVKIADTDVLYFSVPETAAQYAGLTVDHNLIYFSDDTQDVAEHRTSPVTGKTIAEWRTLMSGDDETQIYEDTDKPVPGWASVDAATSTDPFNVAYEGTVVTADGASLSTVTLWDKEPAGSWASTGQTLGTTSGTFSYSPSAGGGTYYFAVVAEDDLGNTSLTPINDGDCSTVYTP